MSVPIPVTNRSMMRESPSNRKPISTRRSGKSIQLQSVSRIPSAGMPQASTTVQAKEIAGRITARPPTTFSVGPFLLPEEMTAIEPRRIVPSRGNRGMSHKGRFVIA